MTASLALPEPLLARFRALAFERLERIDATWNALTRGIAPAKADDEMFRELHTLKGDARVVGFLEVSVLCQRLEDLLSAARGRRYRVHEEVDIVVTMAIQFVGMLLRRGAGVSRGIDLDGFLSQIEIVLSQWLRRESDPPGSITESGPRLRLVPGVAAASQWRVGAAATAVYLEHLTAVGSSRDRLRRAWEALARETFERESEPVAPVLEGHAASARDLARALGKRVHVVVEGAAEAHPDVLDVLGVAALHGVRNAVDHGVDTPAERVRCGKSVEATLRLRVAPAGNDLELEVSDDGKGVDFEAARAKAARLGLRLASDDEEGLAAVLFAPGFSTRDSVTEISGRGVGLDAVSAAVHRLGGRARIESARGRGTTLRVVVPNRRASLDVHVFRPPGATLPFAVDTAWTLHPAPSDRAPVDPLALVGLPNGTPPGIALVHIELRKAGRACVVPSALPPRLALAARLCPTSPEHPAEIVRLDEVEAVLFKPECVGDRTREELHG